MNARALESAIANERWLARYLKDDPPVADGGPRQAIGIIEPSSGCAPTRHYATSHYALLCAALARLTGAREYANRSDSVVATLLRPSREYRSDRRCHWEFDLYAVVETLALRDEDLGRRAELWRSASDLPHHRRPHATNWKALLAASLWRRSTESLRRRDRLLSFVFASLVKASQDEWGCFQDESGRGNSSQYHAFTTALLLRWGLHSGDRALLNAAGHGVHYLSQQVSTDGAIGWRGRGQLQIFGQAAAYYCLATAAAAHPAANDRWANAAHKVLERLLAEQRADGSFPLVMRADGERRGPGWYSYNYLTVYNAFCSAWVALGILDGGPRHSVTGRRIEAPGTRRTVGCIGARRRLRRVETAVLERSPFRVTVSANASRASYSADCGYALDLLSVDGHGPLVAAPGGAGWDPREQNRHAPYVEESGNNRVSVADLPSRILARGQTSVALGAGGRGLEARRKVTIARDAVVIWDAITLGASRAVLGLVHIPLLMRDVRELRRESEKTFTIQLKAMGTVILRIETDPAAEGLVGNVALETAGETRTIKFVVNRPEPNRWYVAEQRWELA